MGLFKSKAEKERERKLEVRKAISKMEKRIADLEKQEPYYIEQAKIGIREGLPQQVELAKSALRQTISEKKRTYMMLLNARIIYQMKETAVSTKGFLEAVQTISKSISANTAGVDMSKVRSGLAEAMDKVSDQTEELEEMLEESQEDILSEAQKGSKTTDADLDAMIYGEAEAQSKEQDADLDSALESLKKYL